MFQFQNILTVGDVVNIILLLTTGLTLLLAYRQIRSSYAAQKAAFFKELFLMSTSDTEIRDAFLLIEYDEFVYDDHFHNQSKQERMIDAMLNFYDLLCDLYFQKIVTNHEMEAFRPRLLRLYQNKHIRKYTNYLRVFYLSAGFQSRPYDAFLRYCEKELVRFLKVTKKDSKLLVVNDAIVFYEEQQGKLDELIALVEETQTSPESALVRKVRAVDILIHCFQILHVEAQLADEDPLVRDQRVADMLGADFRVSLDSPIPNSLREAIAASKVYDPSRLVIALEALKAKLVAEENRNMHSSVFSVPESISMRHLFSADDKQYRSNQ